MRRCTYCFRFHAGSPTYCSRCGRTFGVRICSRGHVNHRAAAYCADCGSAELSTPAPHGSLLFRLSGIALYACLMAGACVVLLAIALAALQSIDLGVIAGPLVCLVLMLGVLYWTTTLLPGPIRKVGKAAGHAIAKRLFGKGKNHH